MRIQCLFGYHHRSRGLAHEAGSILVSVCEGCGTPMKKLPSGKWVVAKSPE